MYEDVIEAATKAGLKDVRVIEHPADEKRIVSLSVGDGDDMFAIDVLADAIAEANDPMAQIWNRAIASLKHAQETWR